MQIETGAVDVWEIETFASNAYRLAVPADGRAFVTELPCQGMTLVRSRRGAGVGPLR